MGTRCEGDGRVQGIEGERIEIDEKMGTRCEYKMMNQAGGELIKSKSMKRWELVARRLTAIKTALKKKNIEIDEKIETRCEKDFRKTESNLIQIEIYEKME